MRSSAGEHLVHTEGVTGSIPVASTIPRSIPRWRRRRVPVMSSAFRCALALAVALAAPTAARAESWTSLGKVVLNEWVTEFVGLDVDSIRTVDGHVEARVVYASPARRQFSGVEFDYTVEIERYDCEGR